jgi:hypothetical protein
MAKKQTVAKETATAAPRRAAKPRAPRVTAATHSKTAGMDTPAHPVTESTTATAGENPHDAIARLAYGYWEAGGQQSGTAAEDWVRAEREYRQLTATSQK